MSHQPNWLPPLGGFSLAELRQRLEAAVESHLMCEVPFGLLLSGGLDSSLVASIAQRLRSKPDGDHSAELRAADWCVHLYANSALVYYSLLQYQA